MEWFVALGVVMLTGVVLVGLFLGPTHRPARRRAPAPPATTSTTEPTPHDKPVYQLPPPGNRLGDRTRLTRTSTRRRPRVRR